MRTIVASLFLLLVMWIIPFLINWMILIITAKKAKISFFNKKWNRSTKARKGFLFLLMSIFTPISIFFPDWVNFKTLIIIDMVFIYTLTDYLYRDMKGESLHFSEQKNIDKSNLMV